MKRSTITVAHQFHWNTTFEAGLKKLHELKTGQCNLTGKTFGELIRKLIVVGDKICMHASPGHLNVIGSTEQNNNYKILHNYCCSIKMYRTGSVTYNTGPPIFILGIESILSRFNDKLLNKKVAKQGSTIIMTLTDFVTEETWKTMTQSLVKELLEMPIVKENPQWWMLQISNGFGPHLLLLSAMEIWHDNKILSMK